MSSNIRVCLQKDLWLFFGITSMFFVVTPIGIMLWRLLLHPKQGLMTMFKVCASLAPHRQIAAAALAASVKKNYIPFLSLR